VYVRRSHEVSISLQNDNTRQPCQITFVLPKTNGRCYTIVVRYALNIRGKWVPVTIWRVLVLRDGARWPPDAVPRVAWVDDTVGLRPFLGLMAFAAPRGRSWRRVEAVVLPHVAAGCKGAEKDILKKKRFYALVGCDSSVSIATRYGLDGPGIESWWGQDFPHSSRPALGRHSASYAVGTRSIYRS
jgi:hypothetical protein